MQTETGAGEAKAGGKKQRVQDEFGGIYELKSKLAEGGQGIVLSTDFQNLLVKVSRWPDGDPRTQAWRKQVEALQRMPVVDEGLPVVMPKARIVKPRAGYVMELVDGLIPLELLLKESIESFASGMGLQGFVSSGGLARRLRVLARLARVLAQLHGLGLAHGDISPKNVFVSTSHDQGEVWLIDCDNLTYAVRDSSLQVYTPDYGAPEILRGDAGISTYTDVWSFAVIAFQLLVQLHPFKGGELVDQDSDLEVAALRGELPWIDHRDDARNRSAMGIDREYVLTPLLVELFDRCFRLGVVDPELRPTMGEWAEAFEAATAVQVLCLDSIGCGSTFYWNKAIQCPFCDTRHDPSSVLRLSHAVYASPAELGEDAAPAHSWIATDIVAVLSANELVLRAAPPGTSAYLDSAVAAALQIDGDELVIRAGKSKPLHLQVSGAKSGPALRGTSRIPRDGRVRALHVGPLDATHDVWRFKW
ncbi:MAG: protein kinase [Burkholderiales bacterium]|jgi:DNA-binding helix-hairpin-helix protein with protein kinase domain|nr:protein kinase [Burkholderiales bacterium]